MISTIVLARLLVPADFGIVALATSMIELLAILGALGLELSLIQNVHAERRHFDTVWTFNALFGLALAVLMFLLAEPASRFYDQPHLTNVFFGLAIARAITGFQNVGVILFQKQLAFDRDFRFKLYKRLATTFLATIPLAFFFGNYWALVGGTIAGSCIGLALSYGMHPYRPRWSLAAFGEMFGFAKWLQFAQLVRVVSARSTDFIIARFSGLSALGSFSLAREIAELPSAEFTMAVHGGVFPGYAKISGDQVLLKRTYLGVVSVLLLVSLPAAIGMALVAQPLVHVFLGPRWSAVVPLLQILALHGLLTMTSRSAAYVYLALGMSHLNATLATIRAAVSLSSMLLLVPAIGVQGAALALLVGGLVAAPVNLRMMYTALEVSARDLVSIAWRPLIATVLMAATVAVFIRHRPPADTVGGSVLSLGFAVVICTVVYAGTVLLLWRLASSPDGAESFVLARLRVLAAASRAWSGQRWNRR